ncbi:MAG: hypothetical protein HKO65_17345 [Gemmatimonadetes bacterium]|nr:hypothetical protein [Gemmatimonadota bacterium]
MDPSKIRTVPVEARPNKVSSELFAGISSSGSSFGEFLDSLPRVLEADSFRAVAQGVASAAQSGKGVLWMLGGHTVKTGLAPLLIRMMERGAATFIGGNGSVAIHDYEVARWGGTSEDVESGLDDGSFGMAEETGREMNDALRRGSEMGMGFGEALGWALSERDDLVAPDHSLLLQAYHRGITVSIHAAIGCEIIHQHPSADGAAIGDCSMRDFRRLAQWLPTIHEGGAVLNLGSAVVMPEVFLKALTMARNVHEGRPRGFLAADFDMIRHYRPWTNVVQRPTRTGGGDGFRLTGHHEIMIPLLAWAVEEFLDVPSANDPKG